MDERFTIEVIWEGTGKTMDIEVDRRMRACDLLALLWREAGRIPGRRQWQHLSAVCSFPDTVIRGNGSLRSFGLRQGSLVRIPREASA